MLTMNDLETYTAIKNDPNHVAECRLIVNGIAYGQDYLISASSESQIMGSEAPSIGNACAGTLTVEMLKPDAYFPENAPAIMQERIRSGSLCSEWVDRGHYWIDKRKITRDKQGNPISIRLECFDGIARTERDYDVPQGTWINKTDVQVLSEVCQNSGIQSDWSPNNGYIISSAPNDMTGRDIIGFIAGMYGGNAICKANGHLAFVPLKTGEIAAYENAGRMYTGDKMAPFDSVIVHQMNGTKFEAYRDQGEDGVTMNFDCPWATQQIADDILNVIAGYRYLPFSLEEMETDIRLECGDTISFKGITERAYTISTSYRSRLISEVSAPDRAECAHDYQTPSGGGGGGGGSGKKTSDDKEWRFARKDLVADIGDVRSGVYAIASANDIENIKEAHTTLFAKVFDEAGNDSIAAKINLSAKEINGVKSSLASVSADVIKLQGDTQVVGNFTQSGGVVTCKAPLMADSIATAGQLSGRTLVVNSQEYAAKTITSTSGQETVLAV